MGFFRTIRRSSQVLACSDTYSLSVPSKTKGIIDAVRQRENQDRFLLVVSHFPETFFQIQDAFNDEGIAYELVEEPTSGDIVDQWRDEANHGRVRLALASLLQTDLDDEPRYQRTPSSMIVCERHPLPRHDRRLREFCGYLGCPMRLGYFVSLKDPIVKPLVGEWTEMVLRQMGLRDHELVTSHLVSRRLEVGFRKLDRRVIEEHAADSPDEWLRLNAPWLLKG